MVEVPLRMLRGPHIEHYGFAHLLPLGFARVPGCIMYLFLFPAIKLGMIICASVSALDQKHLGKSKL